MLNFSNKKVLFFRDEGLGVWNENKLVAGLRRLTLNPSRVGVVVFLHVVVLMVVPFPVLHVTVLKVGVDVEVVVHAVQLLGIHLVREVALQLLQLVLGEEVGFWEHHLMETTMVTVQHHDSTVCAHVLTSYCEREADLKWFPFTERKHLYNKHVTFLKWILEKYLTEKWMMRRPFSNGLRYVGIPSFTTHFVSPGLINSPVKTNQIKTRVKLLIKNWKHYFDP